MRKTVFGLLLGLVTAALLTAATVCAAASADKVYYLRDGGTGDGSSSAAAGGSLTAAYAALPNGGTVVVCGEYTLSAAFTGVANAQKITLTSAYGGTDFAKTNRARMVFEANFYCGGDTEFRDITLCANGTYLSVFGCNHALTLGDGITSERVGSAQYLSVMGGSRAVMRDASTDLTISSGKWQRVRGGTAAGGSRNYTVRLTVNGGEFVERLTLGDSLSHDGDIAAEISGGVFYQGVCAATLSSASDSFRGNVSLTLNGGCFYGRIALAASDVGRYDGSFGVTINGGEFAHLVELVGSKGLDGTMTSALVSSVDLNEKESGTYTFTNYVRADGADPWLFYHDGYYYYTSTTNKAELKLVRVANIGDLIHSGGTTIYAPAAGQPYSVSTWSPEIHYYTDAEIGAGNGGWYCYLAGSDTTDLSAAAHRMYVIKCLDGDNLLGRWGNPLTGEVNVPQVVDAPDIKDFHDVWAAGMTDIRIGGKVYTMYVTVVDDGGGKKHQTINIVEMKNPWTIAGSSSVICEPELDWEIGNHKNLCIVECGTAVYAPDGSIFIVYSACGYSTPEYKLGQLKYLGGDPTKKSSWEKKPTPILSKSNAISGCGSACYVTDTAGQGWICYNAYLSPNASGGRYAFVEPYTADADNGVVIGSGSTHPASLDTVYTAELNPMPLADKTSRFDSIEQNSGKFTFTRSYDDNFTDVTAAHWFYSFVRDAYRIGLANGTSQTKFSPDMTFTVAQAITAAANIHRIYNGKTVRAAAAGEAWYTPYAEYCVQNGIISDGQFASYDANITRGDMAIVFANILPDSEYAAVRDGGAIPDVTDGMACCDAVRKLYRAGIVSGDAGRAATARMTVSSGARRASSSRGLRHRRSVCGKEDTKRHPCFAENAVFGRQTKSRPRAAFYFRYAIILLLQRLQSPFQDRR